jgi:UDP-N-acetyl-D-galactosamine dehydrogenase
MVSFESLIEKKENIAIVGLGYVGLPLAVILSRFFNVVGYDQKAERIEELTSGNDRTMEVSKKDLTASDILFTDNPKELSACRLIIIAVPTPIDKYKVPDLGPLREASSTAGKYMTKGSCVVYESTVYPGATEEICIPILERESGYTCGSDFTVGYSPERVNPGDKEHTIENIVKVVAGFDIQTRSMLSKVYGKVVKKGIHEVSSIKVAEAAKVIENTQRDLNIALMNELSMIFDRIDIDTAEVLTAAGTKWNFLPFTPGLVGGHCIGVDPYYLTFKAESLGYNPEMILSGRRINDSMGKYIAGKAVKLIAGQGKRVKGSKIAVLGITFKEDVPDLRNTKVVDIVSELNDFDIDVVVHDPLADKDEARSYYGIELQEMESISEADAVIVAVMHDYYKQQGLLKIARLCTKGPPIIIDVKSGFNIDEAEKENIIYWRL